jgi:two-component system, OmpR family, response regulator
VLVVEDDDAVRDAVAESLRAAAYEVSAHPDGTHAGTVVRTFRPDLAVLDVRLPVGPDGLHLPRMLRASIPDLPILLLTAADSVDDRLAGFEAGADDYLVKPFAMAELHARVKALLRRAGRLHSEVWQVGDITIDEARRTVVRGGEPVYLTATEFGLLLALARDPGRVLSKTRLLADVWGFDAYDPNLVEVHISSLRRKLEAAGPRIVKTVRGAGYALES